MFEHYNFNKKNMHLKEYISRLVISLEENNILEAEFVICLDEKGSVVRDSHNTIKFSITNYKFNK